MNIPAITLSGPVRHVGLTDILSSHTISSTTQQLAARDEELSDKLNEIITALKELDQKIAVVVPKIIVPGLEREVMYNLRIPAGYKAAIINAAVSGSVAGKALLTVAHSVATYGSTGDVGVTDLVGTYTEYAASGQYVGEGELVIAVQNSHTSSIEIAASVLVSLQQV